MPNWMSRFSVYQQCGPNIHIYYSYSDDEDTSYKIRRSATKLLAAVIGTRPELLVALYKDVSPVLISRFGDREETVRTEIWATYGALLNQTKVYAGVPQAKDAEYSIGGKRKRDEGMDVEDTPLNLLNRQVPSLAKSLLGQLKSSKTSPATLQAGFTLLNSLLTVLPGCLSTQAPQVISNSKTVLLQSSTSAASLQVSCLSFLGIFFRSHSPSTFSSSLNTILPQLLKSLSERHPKITSEAYRTFSSLLNNLKPIEGADWVERIYTEAVSRLANHDTDAEVRACAEAIIGDLWISAPSQIKTKDRKEWEAICRTSGRTEGAVEVVTRVAREVEMDNAWLNGCVEWTLSLLKRSGRSGKNDLFVCLDALLRR
jgi:cullin-associated NEDD8-dissociated protein 1